MLSGHDGQRRFSRVKMVQQVRLGFQHTSYGPCRIKDVNLTGMFVFGKFYQRAGDECIVEYSQTRSASHFYFKARAVIVRTIRAGVALEFISMPMDSYVLLQSTLLFEAVDPLTLVQELPADCPFEITNDI